jgi:hypothetical protein
MDRRGVPAGRPAARSSIVTEGGADRRSAKNAAAPLNQSREAHLAAWPLHAPSGDMTSTDGSTIESRVRTPCA